MRTYWVTLAIEEEELAGHLGCNPDEVEERDYFGAVRDFADIVKHEVIEEEDT